MSGRSLEQLTEDHRVVVSAGGILSRPRPRGECRVEIDYHVVGIEAGDTFVLTTDGVHEHVRPRDVLRRSRKPRPSTRARAIVEQLWPPAVRTT